MLKYLHVIKASAFRSFAQIGRLCVYALTDFHALGEYVGLFYIGVDSIRLHMLWYYSMYLVYLQDHIKVDDEVGSGNASDDGEANVPMDQVLIKAPILCHNYPLKPVVVTLQPVIGRKVTEVSL